MRKLSGLLIALALSCMMAWGQQRTITGKVTDDNGNAVPYASIKVKGAKTGVSADANGAFTIQAATGAVLEITGVGFTNAVVTVAESNVLSISLKTDANSLGEVVVTGLGRATEKKKVPIDVASVTSKDFAKSANTSAAQALQGQIAGAQIQQNSGQPGASFNIILRGINTFQNSNPMIMVDGVETRRDDAVLTSLDPSSIERIEVVKGAAGGMLYGAQGANGVIQIFTKKGARNAKMAINLSSKVSIDKVLRGKKSRPLLADKHHFVTDNQGRILDNNGDVLAPDATGYWPDPQEDLTVDSKNDKNYSGLPLYDHLDQAFRKAITYTHSLTMSGGSANSDYSFNVARLDQQDVFSNNFRRTNLGVNLGFEPFKGFTVRNITQVIYTTEDLLSGNRFAVVNAWKWIDFERKDSLGRHILQPKNENQINSLSERDWHVRNDKTVRLVQNLNVNYRFPRFVELDYKYGIDYKTIEGLDYYKNQTGDDQSALFWGNIRGGSKSGSVEKSSNRNSIQNSIASLFLRTDFQNDFHLNIPIKTVTQVAYDYRREDDKELFAFGTGLPTYPPYNVNVSTTKTSGDRSTAFVTYGWLLNQSIEFGNLAGVSAGFRSDYSSEFGGASKAFNFPRGTVFFRPSELMTNKNILQEWKLRAAWAKAGIQPNRYDRQVTFDVTPLGSGTGLSIPTRGRNANLRVQISQELEIGTDVVLQPFKGDWFSRLSLNGTYWTRKSKDVIQNADVAPSTGYASLTDNLSTLESHGVDLSLDATMYSAKNVVWNLGARFGFTRTKVVSIANNQDVISGQFAIKEGENLGIFYGVSPLHSIDQLMADGKTRYIDPSQAVNYTITNGMVVDKRTNTVFMTSADDQSAAGSAYPNFTASLINNFTLFKNWNVSFQFDWTHGNKIYNMTRQWLYRDRLSKDFDEAVTIGEKSGAFVQYYNSLYNNVQPSSWFVEDGSFVRLRNLSITYDLTSALNVSWFKTLAITVAGRNLLTFTKYKGLDPENTTAVDSQGNSTVGVGAFKGVDYFGIPNLRSWQLGVNVGF